MSTTTDAYADQEFPVSDLYDSIKLKKSSFGAKLLAGGLVASYRFGTLISRPWSEGEHGYANVSIFNNDSIPMPGEAVTEKVMEQKKRMNTALSLIDDFSLNGYSWSGEEFFKISASTANAAKALLGRLEPDFGLPKIVPNDEEALVMVWETAVDPVLLVVDKWKLHLVKSATTPRATYHEDIPFDGEDVPKEVVAALRQLQTVRAVEDHIPDDATVCRLIHQPRMGADKNSLILESYFQFTRSKENPKEYYGESLVWTRYAEPVPQKVHELGIEFQNIRLNKIPERPCMYIGFVSSFVQTIREYKNLNGHCFKVYDAPEEDAPHHVEVGINLVPNVSLRKGEKEELQLFLARIFSALVSIS